MDEKLIKNLIIEAGKTLIKEKLIVRTWGNISSRVDKESFAITPSGRDYLTLKTEEIVKVNIETLNYKGQYKPSSEMKVHRVLYQEKEDVNFVIHTHQENATAVSAMGLSEVDLGREYERIGRKIYCSDYAPSGTDEIAENIKIAVSKSNGKAVIMKNHGALCFGKTYEEAHQVACNLEFACEEYLDKVSYEIRENKDCNQVYLDNNSIYNKDYIVMEFSKLRKDLLPFVDDFAQIVGDRAVNLKEKEYEEEKKSLGKLRAPHAIIIYEKGSVCLGASIDDAEAISMIVRKNVKAYFAAKASGNIKPIEKEHVKEMRKSYIENYSKLK